MVDNRSAGHFGIGGSFNFKSGDISGTAAKTSDDKMGQGGEYFAQGRKKDGEEEQKPENYVDRSAQLRASLSSLAAINAVKVRLAKDKNKAKVLTPKESKRKKSKKILATSENEAEKDSLIED